MTFEDQLLDKAQKDIEATEKLCTESSSASSAKRLSSLKKAFGLSSNSLAQDSKKQIENGSSFSTSPASVSDEIVDKFTKAIILADCKLYLAILTFIRQDISGYLSSGLV